MSGPPFTDEDLAAWLDGEVDDGRRAAIAAWLREHPEDQRRVDAWRAQNAALRAVLDPVAAEPVPHALTHAVDAAATPRRWRQAAVAAVLVIIGGLAGLGGGFALWADPGQSPSRVIAAAGLSAHRVYSAEQRHAVEVRADETDHLSAWLSNRLDATIDPPDLSSEGLTLLGGRLVAEAGRPGALLMYEAEGGERFTVFVVGTQEAGETPLRYARAGENCAFYWVDGRLTFVVSGPDNPDRVRQVARAVYARMG